jgi:hypothetical protein
MTTIFVEVQYDPGRREMLMQASTGMGGDVYRVAKRDCTHEEGIIAAQDFVRMYRQAGAEVVT